MPWFNKFPDLKNNPAYLEPRVTAAETSLADISTIKPTGNVATDTANLQNCSGKSVRLAVGTFVVNQITWGQNTHVIGAGISKTIIKLANNANTSVITMLDADWSGISKLTIDGNRANNPSTANTKDVACLCLKTTLNGGWNQRSIYNDVEIKNGANNGLSILGGYETGTSNSSWIVMCRGFYIFDCSGYCFYDSSTDNHYSDFYISHGSRAALMCDGTGSTMYSNFKTDGLSGDVTYVDRTSSVDGANIIVNNCTNLIFSNLDCQASAHVGMKILGSNKIQVNGNFDTNGQRTPTSDGTGLYIANNSGNITGTVHFWVTSGSYQPNDLYIDSSCSNISLFSETITDSKVSNSGYNCSISSTRKIGQDSKHNKDLINGFFKAYSKNTSTANGFASAVNKGLVASNLLLWLEGSKFPTTQTNWIDDSGFGNDVTPTNFAFTTSSGSDGAGGVNFDTVDDYVVSPVLPAIGNLNLSTTNPLTVQVTFTPPAGITSSTPLMGTIKNTNSTNYAKWGFYISSSVWYFVLWDNVNIQNSFGVGAPSYTAGTQVTMTAVIEKINNAIFCTYYKNGVFVSRNTQNYTGNGHFNGIGNFAIQGMYGASTPLNMKRVRVYNMALTADEVLQNYNSGN